MQEFFIKVLEPLKIVFTLLPIVYLGFILSEVILRKSVIFYLKRYIRSDLGILFFLHFINPHLGFRVLQLIKPCLEEKEFIKLYLICFYAIVINGYIIYILPLSFVLGKAGIYFAFGKFVQDIFLGLITFFIYKSLKVKIKLPIKYEEKEKSLLESFKKATLDFFKLAKTLLLMVLLVSILINLHFLDFLNPIFKPISKIFNLPPEISLAFISATAGLQVGIAIVVSLLNKGMLNYYEAGLGSLVCDYFNKSFALFRRNIPTLVAYFGSIGVVLAILETILLLIGNTVGILFVIFVGKKIF